MQYWLLKSEADCYSIDDLKKDKKTAWTEVRNYQARNFLRSMEVGDKVLFYHSNGGDETGVVGIAEVCKEAYVDPTQFVEGGEYFDPRSTKEEPRWSAVDVKFVEKFKTNVLLTELKKNKSFATMGVLQRGSRLSVLPILKDHFGKITSLGSK